MVHLNIFILSFRVNLSTETAVKVTNDLVMLIFVLVLLDISPVFNTTDRNILLQRLEHTSLVWIIWISDIFQFLHVNGESHKRLIFLMSLKQNQHTARLTSVLFDLKKVGAGHFTHVC